MTLTKADLDAITKAVAFRRRGSILILMASFLVIGIIQSTLEIAKLGANAERGHRERCEIIRVLEPQKFAGC